MEITLMFAPGCSSAQPTEDRVRSVLERLRVDADVRTVVVTSPEEAQRLRFPGSPTVRIDGRDLEPEVDESLPFGLG